jgi:hypothetical protein
MRLLRRQRKAMGVGEGGFGVRGSVGDYFFVLGEPVKQSQMCQGCVLLIAQFVHVKTSSSEYYS